MTGQLRIEILGPLRVFWQDEPVALEAQRLQTLLAVLALRANQVCTAEDLLDLVWDDKPPGTGLKILPPYIYRLRRVLPTEVLQRTTNGYILRLPPGTLDIADFEAAADHAAALRDNGDLDGAATAYTQALDLFRGEPLAGLPGQFLAAQRRRLTERRNKVFADRVDVDLARGHTTDLIAELVPAVAAHPFDERLAGQLMQALTADGRQAEALDLYTRTRQTLIDQLGIEPGPALRDLHQSILRNESAATTTRDELPYAGAVFVGREPELDRLTSALESRSTSAPPVVAIDGMAGSGKTALALHAARRLADQYPDGLLFADLHGHTSGRGPRDVKSALDHLLAGAGVTATAIPPGLEEARALWRTTVAGRRLLIVLDNARDSSAVTSLLPGSPTCGVVITSRAQLTGLDVHERMHLDLLSPVDATALLSRLIGAERAAADVAASNGLIERCGNLPLALRIAGARLRYRPAWTVAHINDRLDRVGRRLPELSTDGLAVSTAFELSYEQLPVEQQRFFRLLGLVPGADLDQYGAAALTGLDPAEASDLAESLVDANLLLQRAPGRYEFHDLLREYAHRLALDTDAPSLRSAARDGLLEYYLQACFHPFITEEGQRYFDPGPRPPHATPRHATAKGARAWGDAEADNLAAAVEYAATTDDPVRTWQLALAVAGYLERRGKVQQQDRILALGLTAAEVVGDKEVQSRVLLATGTLNRQRRGAHFAAEKLRRALDILPAEGDLLLRGLLHSALGAALRTLDPLGESLTNLREATRIGRELKHEPLIAQSLTYTGIMYTNVPDDAAAVEAYVEAIEILNRIQRGGMMSEALSGLTNSYLAMGRVEDAIATATAAYDLSVEIGNKISLPWALGSLGSAFRANGELERAVEIHRQAVAAAEEVNMVLTIWAMQLSLGESLLAIGDTAGALACYQPVLTESTAAKDYIYVVETLSLLADHAVTVDDREAAVGYLTQGLAVAAEHTPTRCPGLREKLAKLTG
ncbi:BTAD domain-containing putative transcriptional regulator [Kribbella sp. NPDC051587]|uniref:AfsR/SARP family transcriptional regulator n=1 Tax=Kribbella sp. NPDC051587 TaxID=3364119 RepID=UPI0037AC519A